MILNRGWPDFGTRAAKRGANWDNGSNARSVAALNLNNAPSNRWNNIGFRAALSKIVDSQRPTGPTG